MRLRASRQTASAVMVVLGLLGILSLYVLVNARTLARLKHDVRQIEQRQILRLQSPSAPASASPHSLTNLSGIRAVSPSWQLPER